MVDIINLTMAVTSLMSNVSQTEIQSLPYKYNDYISHDQTAQVYSNASLDFYEYDVGTEETVLRHAKIDNDLHDQTTWAYSTYYEDLSTYSFSNHDYNRNENTTNNLIFPNWDERMCDPLSSICHTKSMTSKDEWISGSCVVVSKNMILSAAHCFLNETGIPYSSPTIEAIQNDFKDSNTNAKGFNHTFEVSKILYPKAYVNGLNRNPKYDWCFCVLKKSHNVSHNIDVNISYYTGYQSIVSGYTLAGCYNYACGYPGGDLKETEKYMNLSYSPACEIREPDTFSKENDLYNLCNYATEGMSGGPLFFYYEDRNTFKDVQGVAGIIIEKNTIDSHAYAVKINNYMINIIRSYN